MVNAVTDIGKEPPYGVSLILKRDTKWNQDEEKQMRNAGYQVFKGGIG
jgi:hypothetical protein